MAEDTIPGDLEQGPSPIQGSYPPPSSKSFGSTSPPLPAQTPDPAIEEKEELSQDGFGSDLPRRDTDPSAKIWGLYHSLAKKFDKERSDSWVGSTDGVLVFTGLFSATVATFIVASYPTLQRSPGDTTVLLLSQISQQLAALSNGTPSPALLTASDLASFQPTPSAVRVNTLWFVSLGLSTVCALLATLMQQWTRRYVQVADGPHGQQKRARLRAFFAGGVERFALGAAVEILPAILHLSVLIFYIGLIDFLLNIDHTVAFTMLSFLASCVLVYFVLSIMPLCFHDSPYQTPVSAIYWFILEAAPLVKLWFLKRSEGAQHSMVKRCSKIGQGMRRALEEIAIMHVTLDLKAVEWTLRYIDGDHEQEEFLDGPPGLFPALVQPAPSELRKDFESTIESVANKLLATCSSGLLPEPAHRRRLTVCLGAIWCFPNMMERHFRAVQDQWMQGTMMSDPWCPMSTETCVMAANMTTNSDSLTALRAHCVQALIVIMRRYGRWRCLKSEWSALLQRQLGVSAHVIERFLHRDYLELAVAANLLTNALPLLRKMEADGGPSTSLKVDVKAILDSICARLDTSDLPEELRSRFVDSKEVFAVFHVRDPASQAGHRRRHRTAFDMSGPWSKVFASGTKEDYVISARPPTLTRLSWAAASSTIVGNSFIRDDGIAQ